MHGAPPIVTVPAPTSPATEMAVRADGCQVFTCLLRVTGPIAHHAA
jgi:hypothetical protein